MRVASLFAGLLTTGGAWGFLVPSGFRQDMGRVARAQGQMTVRSLPVALSCFSILTYIFMAQMEAARALVIQNKGGGHGELGYHLALKLAREKGVKVTLLNDNFSEKKEPFKVRARAPRAMLR
jgi:hypothetical protein